MTHDPTPFRFVCRCEEIGEAEVVAAISAGARTIDDVKRQTRAGMGACQAVYCARPLAQLLRDHTGVPLNRVVPMTARPPARPLPLALLADLEP